MSASLIPAKPVASTTSACLRRPSRHGCLRVNAWSIPKVSSQPRNSQARDTKLEGLHANSSETPSVADHIEATRLKFAQLNDEISSQSNEDHGMYFSHIASRLVHEPSKSR